MASFHIGQCYDAETDQYILTGLQQAKKKSKNATILHCGVYHTSSACKLSENTLNEVLQKLISQKKWSHYARLFWWLIFYPRFHVRSS